MKIQSAGVQRIVVTKITQKEAMSGQTESGTAWSKPAHQLISCRARLVELVDKQPDQYERLIAITNYNLSARLDVGETYDVVIYVEAKGKAGEKVEYHLVSCLPVASTTPSQKKASN